MAFRALIPPKIASPSSISGSATAQRMVRVVEFYSKGPAPQKRASLNPIRAYARRYFDGENASGAPVVHVLLFGLVLGYGLNFNHIYHSTHPHEGEHH